MNSSAFLPFVPTSQPSSDRPQPTYTPQDVHNNGTSSTVCGIEEFLASGSRTDGEADERRRVYFAGRCRELQGERQDLSQPTSNTSPEYVDNETSSAIRGLEEFLALYPRKDGVEASSAEQRRAKRRRKLERPKRLLEPGRIEQPYIIRSRPNLLTVEDPKSFYNTLSMNSELFEELLAMMEPFFQRHRNSVKIGGLGLRLKLQGTLQYLASGDSLSSLDTLFGLSPSSMSRFLPKVLRIIHYALVDYFKVPLTVEEWKKVSRQFTQVWNFPQCCGAIGGKRIMLKQPRRCSSSYFDYVLQALVDADYKFIYVNIGTDDKSGNVDTFETSAMNEALHTNSLHMPDEHVVLGDEAFPLKTYLMKPYDDDGSKKLGEREAVFNYRLFRARQAVENAFGVLFWRFRIFSRPIELKTTTVDDLILATCSLHNWLRSRSPAYICAGSVDKEDADTGEIIRGEWRDQVGEIEPVMGKPAVKNDDPRAYPELIRKQFTNFFWEVGVIPSQWKVIGVKPADLVKPKRDEYEFKDDDNDDYSGILKPIDNPKSILYKEIHLYEDIKILIEYYEQFCAPDDHNLLSAIDVPFTQPGMYFDQGDDGFPAFGILPSSDIKEHYRVHLPLILYREFSIVCTVSVKSKPGGFVFAVMNPTETVVQLGVQLQTVDPMKLNISLFYTDVAKSASSQNVASFIAEPYQVGQFIRFQLLVTNEQVKLIYNCDKKETRYVKRHPEELIFDPASILYVGQAGPIIKGNLDILVVSSDDSIKNEKSEMCKYGLLKYCDFVRITPA